MSITPRTDSIVARECHAEERVMGYYNTSGEARDCGDLDTFWGEAEVPRAGTPQAEQQMAGL